MPSADRGLRALVYGDVNLNLIDGSAIWLQGMVEVLARAGCAVSLLLKSPVETTRLLDPLTSSPQVTLYRPYEDGLLGPGAGADAGAGLSPREASRLIRDLDERGRFDLVVLRGQRVVRQVVVDGGLDGRLWPYLTDIPQSVPELTETARAQLAEIAEASRFLLCQTEELRCFLEGAVPATCGKCLLFPPLVADLDGVSVPEPRHPPPADRPLRLVYTGKFARRWNTYEMTALPGLLRARGVPAELAMVGDKIHDEPADPDYSRRMRRALGSTPGVAWHGGHARAEAMRLAGTCDVGLSWRDPDLDASLELSTKVLEFGALGLPVVLNRTPMHEDLLGTDYPLFVDGGGVGRTVDSEAAAVVADVIAAAVRSPGSWVLAARRCRDAAQRFTAGRAAHRMRACLDRAFPAPPGTLARRGRPLRVGIAGHDLKFFTGLLDHLRTLPGVEVRVDRWEALARHDPAVSRDLVTWADVVFCEWCGPAAVWYSRNKRPGQRLIVRLHRFELYGPWPEQIEVAAVDRVVCVSPYYAALARERTSWPADKVTVLPNWVDTEQYDRPKLPGARFNLGMIGAAPARKRPDLALDVLEELRRRDLRFQLLIKTKMTWDYWWMWRRPEERLHIDGVLRRVQCSPLLRGAVTFDRYGPDVAAWLRRIGFVLSTSDDESFHLAPAEGMASGAVPVVRRWPGAETIYDPHWIRDDPAAMAGLIRDLVAGDRWDEERARARDEVRACYALTRVAESFTELVTSDVVPG